MNLGTKFAMFDQASSMPWLHSIEANRADVIASPEVRHLVWRPLPNGVWVNRIRHYFWLDCGPYFSPDTTKSSGSGRDEIEL